MKSFRSTNESLHRKCIHSTPPLTEPPNQQTNQQSIPKKKKQTFFYQVSIDCVHDETNWLNPLTVCVNSPDQKTRTSN